MNFEALALKKITQRESFIIRVREPFSFSLTVKKPAGWNWITPYEMVEQNRFWSTLRLKDEKLLGIKLIQRKNEVEAIIYSDIEITKEQANEVFNILKIGLGADVDLNAFYKIAKEDNVLKLLIQDLYGMKPYFANSVFERALLAICLQMAPIKRSYEMLDCIIDNYAEYLSFDGKTLKHWPSPNRLRNVTEKELKEKCKLGYRAKFINELSRFNQIPNIIDLWEKPTDEAIKELIKLPGIGKYSAGVILTKNTFPIDVWSSSIFHKLFFGKAPDKPREVIEKVIEEAEKRYKKWKWEAFAYVLNALSRLEPIL
ncbi:MAG: hypothetical protein ACETWM_20765 [Candidatus Lokiarchaeia archaeon]